MADIEADGVVVSLDGGETYRFHDGSGSFSLTDLADQPTPYIARAAGPAFEGSTLAALKAPEFTSKPTITANSSTVGATLGGTNGTWKGNPLPTLSRIFWLKNNVVIPNENGGTLSTATGFAVDDQIIRAVEIQSVINGETVKVTEYSLPFTLTAQQSILIVSMTDPLVAGDDFEIVFNTAPGTVSPSSLVQDQSNPLRYTGIAPDNGTLAIGATKAGWQSFAQTYTYDPKPVMEMGTITVEPDGTISITVPDDAEPFPVLIGGQTVIIDPADYTATSAPVALVQPEIAGQGGDGETLTATGRALFAGHASAGAISLAAGWYRNDTAIGDTDTSYTQDDAVDGDKTLTFRETATNTAGATTAISSGVLCPAAPVADWWHPQALVQIDYANNRARINGTSYASIAAAKTANAIKTSGGVDYVDVPGLGTSYTIAASGTVPNDTTTRVMATVDDGTSANSVQTGQTFSSSTHRALYGVTAGGSSAVAFPTTPALTMGEPIRLAFRAKDGGVYRRVHNGVGVNGSATAALPAVNRLVLGNRSAGDRAWTGGLYHILLINADLADATVDGLLGA